MIAKIIKVNKMKNNKTKKSIITLLFMSSFLMASGSSMANNLGEDRTWQFKTSDKRSIQLTKLNFRINGRFGDARQGAGLNGGAGGGFGGSTIGNNVIINYNINGDNNTIANNSNNIDQENNGDQQSNVNFNSDSDNDNGGDRKVVKP